MTEQRLHDIAGADGVGPAQDFTIRWSAHDGVTAVEGGERTQGVNLVAQAAQTLGGGFQTLARRRA